MHLTNRMVWTAQPPIDALRYIRYTHVHRAGTRTDALFLRRRPGDDGSKEKKVNATDDVTQLRPVIAAAFRLSSSRDVIVPAPLKLNM